MGEHLSRKSDSDTDSSDDEEHCLPTEISNLPKNDRLEQMPAGGEEEWHNDSEKRGKHLHWYLRVSHRLMQNPVSYIASRPICGLKELFKKLKTKLVKHAREREQKHEHEHEPNEQSMLEKYTDETDRKILLGEGEKHSFEAQAKTHLCDAFRMHREPEEEFIARMAKIGKQWQANWAEHFGWMQRKIRSFLHLFSHHSKAEHKEESKKEESETAKKVFEEQMLPSPHKHFDLYEFFHKISTIFHVDKHTAKMSPRPEKTDEYEVGELHSKRHHWEEFLDNLFHRKKHQHEAAHDQPQASNKTLQKLPSLNKQEETTVLASAGGILQMVNEKVILHFAFKMCDRNCGR